MPGLDLTISADDIEFSPTNPAPNSLVEISVRVHNTGSDAISNATVRFFANGMPIGDGVISNLQAGATQVASINALFTNDEVFVIQASVDPDGQIEEIDESNNRATKLLKVGNPGIAARHCGQDRRAGDCARRMPWLPLRARVLRSAVGIITNTYPVEGAMVFGSRSRPGTVYSDTHTDVDGRFSQRIMTPEPKGELPRLRECGRRHARGSGRSRPTCGEHAASAAVVRPACGVPAAVCDRDERVGYGRKRRRSMLSCGIAAT